jgi:hypothetical protein
MDFTIQQTSNRFSSQSILFIDAEVENYQSLISGARSTAEIYVLEKGDAIDQITQILEGRSGIESLQIVSHGKSGGILLGQNWIDAIALQTHADQIAQWKTALTEDADILLFGCSVATGEQGLEFVQAIAHLTEADLAASSDRTGHKAVGGNWELEIQTGRIQTTWNFQQYGGILDTSYHNLALSDFSQDWSNAALITTDHNWDLVPSIMGYRGDGLTSVIGSDPQTLLFDGSTTPINVFANQTNPIVNGGIAEFSGTVALQASGTADAPQLVFHLNATGRQNVRFTFTAKDIDPTDNAITPVAVQYRVGNTGNFTNLSDGAIADITTPGNPFFPRQARLSILLPTTVNNQAQVQIRVLTTNAVSTDEWVAIDDIQVTSSAISANTAPMTTADTYNVVVNSSLTTAPAITMIELDSDPGNYPGQGAFYRYRDYNGTFRITRSTTTNEICQHFSGSGTLDNDVWLSFISATNNAVVVPGNYTNAGRSNSLTTSGLDVSGNGRGYNSSIGEFTINQAIYGIENQVISFDATFKNYYGDGNSITESMRGRLRYRATANGVLPGVLANDTDAQGTGLTATLVSGTQNGLLIFNPDGSFTYTPNAGFEGIDTFTYLASDAITTSMPTTVILTVGTPPTVANAAPKLTLPGTGGSPTEGASQTLFLDSTAIVEDDSLDFDTGTLTVRFANNGTADDRLSMEQLGSAARIRSEGREIYYDNTKIGTFTGGLGTTHLVITFNASVTPSIAQALVRSITYANVSPNPDDRDRTVEFILTDGDGGTSEAVTKTVRPIGVSPTSGILWRHYRTGEVSLWTLQDTTLKDSIALTPVPDLNWIIEAAEDFDGDGDTDLLWRHYETGEVSTWMMNGNSVGSYTTLPWVPDLAWRIEATADFSNDGKRDILWHHNRTGEVAIWTLNGSTLQAGFIVGTRADLNWNIEQVGDLTGDRKPDILWRNQRTGAVEIWQLNGTQLEQQRTLYGAVDLAWRIVGLQDCDRDGDLDLVWENFNSREISFWELNAGSLKSYTQPLKWAAPYWTIVSSYDFDADGKLDWLFRNLFTGEVMVWEFDGFTPGSQNSVYTVNDLDWTLEGANRFR